MYLWGDETVRYNGQRFQRISESLNSRYFRVKVVTRLNSLPPLTSVPPPNPCAFPSPQNRLVWARSPTLRVGSLAVRKDYSGNATCLATLLKDLLPDGRHIRLYSSDILLVFGKFHTLTTAILIRSTWDGSEA